MVTTMRPWDRLKTLQDDFSRRDFELITAFADALPVHMASQKPGTDVVNAPMNHDEVARLLYDKSSGSLVRTLAKQYYVDNPVEVLTKALNMIGVSFPAVDIPHYTDALVTTTGNTVMKISERVMRESVHKRIFVEFDDLDTAAPGGGMYLFSVKIQYNSPESDSFKTEHLSIRAGSPEEAKSMAVRTATEMNFSNISVLGIEMVKYSGPGQPGLVPQTAPLNVQPNAMAGLVSPSDVSPALSNSNIPTPRSGISGQNLTGGV
jgi:hypothetical protein